MYEMLTSCKSLNRRHVLFLLIYFNNAKRFPAGKFNFIVLYLKTNQNLIQFNRFLTCLMLFRIIKTLKRAAKHVEVTKSVYQPVKRNVFSRIAFFGLFAPASRNDAIYRHVSLSYIVFFKSDLSDKFSF